MLRVSYERLDTKLSSILMFRDLVRANSDWRMSVMCRFFHSCFRPWSWKGYFHGSHLVLREKAIYFALNRGVILRLQPCDIFIFMSGIYLEAAICKTPLRCEDYIG